MPLLYRLQWGHRFTSVETAEYPEPTGGSGRASMGPPIYIGGNADPGRRERLVYYLASMGPPIYIGGNK